MRFIAKQAPAWTPAILNAARSAALRRGIRIERRRLAGILKTSAGVDAGDLECRQDGGAPVSVFGIERRRLAGIPGRRPLAGLFPWNSELRK